MNLGLELFNRFGRRLSERRGARQLARLLSALPPGTAIEGNWLPSLGFFFVSEITFAARPDKPEALGSIECYRLATYDKAGIDILDYPADDWRLELFLNSDRVLAISQPDKETTVADLRSQAHELRVAVLGDVVDRIRHPDVRLLPAAESRFRRAYDNYRLHDFAEGVVMKRCQAPYPQPGTSPWLLHLYEWD